MKVDSFVEFPKSTTSEQNAEESKEATTFEYFSSKAQENQGFADTPTMAHPRQVSIE